MQLNIVNSHDLQGLEFKSAKCIYDTEDQMELVKEFVDIAHNDILAVLRYAPLIKDNSFKDEKEWRLFSTFIEPPHMKFRSGKSMPLPYFNFPLQVDEGNWAITKIRVGPTPNIDLSVRAVECLLASRNIKAKVEKSTIPFRNVDR